MKSILSMILLSAMLLAMPALRARGGAEEALPRASYLGGEKTIGETAGMLKEAGLANTEVFAQWALDFAKTAGREAGLLDEWLAPEKLRADVSKTAEGWEARHDFSDADCRMTAFLLLEGLISAREAEEDYAGSYLMFDLEAIDTAERYESLRGRRALFTTLFGDKPVPEGEAPEAVFEKVWRERGISLSLPGVKLLSLVIMDPAERTVFVGHTGLLAEREEGLLFVEKIAFEQPYQATKASGLQDLLALLAQRPEYFGGPDEPGPFVYLNGNYIGELARP